MNTCIIPARSASKRIKNKNIKKFCGKPIIAYSIQNALDSNIFSNVIVSTDDEFIANIARDYGATTPFIRPKSLSDDLTPTLRVIAHAIKALKSDDNDIICCLYATAPLIDKTHIINAYNAFKKRKEIDYVFYASRLEKSPYRCFNIDNGAVNMLFPDFINTRSQDLPDVYSDSGTLYIANASTFLANKPIFSPRSNALMLDSRIVQDIDTLSDWRIAETKFRLLNKNSLDKNS